VIDANPAALAAGVATGVQFDGVHYDAVSAALTRTVDLYGRAEQWRTIQKNAMKCDFSWTASGQAYADLYRALTA
jgi:starch synthase